MSVYVWGFGKQGQLGLGDNQNKYLPVKLKLGVRDRPANVVSGSLHSAILTQKGDVLVCGCGKHGRLGTGAEDDINVLTKITVAKDTKIAMVSGGSWHMCAVTYMGRLYSWGYNAKHNVLGREANGLNSSFTPGLVPFSLGVQVEKVSCGHNFTLLCTKDGQAYSWGCGRYGVLGHGNEECYTEPKRITALEQVSIRHVNAGYAHCGVISGDGRLLMFGKGGDGALGLGIKCLDNKLEPTWLQQYAGLEFTDVSCCVVEHYGHTLALTAAGIVYAWGSNYKGKLGTGDKYARCEPTKILEKLFEGQKVVQVSAGGIHSGAITADGDVFTWGAGKDGRLGHPDVESKQISYYSAKPRKVLDLPEDMKAVHISCSHYHTMLLMEKR